MARDLLGRERAAAGVGQIVAAEQSQRAVADQLQHVASCLVDGGDDRLGIVVQQRDDLGRLGGVGDGGEAAQIGEPQRRLDAVGDAALDASLQDALAGIAAEIDLDQGVGDPGQRCALDREPKGRREAAQGHDIGVAEALGVARRPGRVDAVHLADRGALGEATDEDDIVGVPLILHLLDAGEVDRIAKGDAPPQFLAAGLQQVIEGTALPGGGGLAFSGAAILGGCGLFDIVVAPAEDGAFMHGVQGVDDHHGARQGKPCSVALLAELDQQVGLLRAFKAAADDPIGDAIDVG